MNISKIQITLGDLAAFQATGAPSVRPRLSAKPAPAHSVCRDRSPR